MFLSRKTKFVQSSKLSQTIHVKYLKAPSEQKLYYLDNKIIWFTALLSLMEIIGAKQLFLWTTINVPGDANS